MAIPLFRVLHVQSNVSVCLKSTVLLPSARPTPKLTPFPARSGQFWLCMKCISSVLGLLVFRAAGELVAVHIIVTCTNKDEAYDLIGVGYLCYYT